MVIRKIWKTLLQRNSPSHSTILRVIDNRSEPTFLSTPLIVLGGLSINQTSTSDCSQSCGDYCTQECSDACSESCSNYCDDCTQACTVGCQESLQSGCNEMFAQGCGTGIPFPLCFCPCFYILAAFLVITGPKRKGKDSSASVIIEEK